MSEMIQSSRDLRRRSLKALVWRVMEKGAQYLIQLIVHVVLARFLLPEDYGVYAVLAAIIAITGILIEGGLPSALIQKKDIDEVDKSSVFWLSITLAATAYMIIAIFAPWIAGFFDMPGLIQPLRVGTLSLFLLVYSAIQASDFMRRLNFRAIFFRTLIGSTLSGIVGVLLAMKGYGVWALVWQQLSYQAIVFTYYAVMDRWIPRLTISLERAKSLLSFGWKICLSTLLKSGYESFLDLILGKAMTSQRLGMYNRGRKFAQVASAVVDDPLKTILFPAFSIKQDDPEASMRALRRIVLVYTTVSSAVLLGVSFFARPIITFLLTDKWADSVVFFQLCCLSYLAYPLSTPSLQMMNAIGRSEIPLAIESIRLVLSVIGLLIGSAAGCSPVALVAIVSITSALSLLAVAAPNSRIINYSIGEQLEDYVKPLLAVLIPFVLLVASNAIFPVLEVPIYGLAAALLYVVLILLSLWILRIPVIKTVISIIGLCQ